jgi:hypothetical protein
MKLNEAADPGLDVSTPVASPGLTCADPIALVSSAFTPLTIPKGSHAYSA